MIKEKKKSISKTYGALEPLEALEVDRIINILFRIEADIYIFEYSWKTLDDPTRRKQLEDSGVKALSEDNKS
jgi:hypothetical protein